jgi:hypothetical protein
MSASNPCILRRGGFTCLHDIWCTSSTIRIHQQPFQITIKPLLLLHVRIMLVERIADARYDALCFNSLCPQVATTTRCGRHRVHSVKKDAKNNAWTKTKLETSPVTGTYIPRRAFGLHFDSVNALFIQRPTTQTSSLNGDLNIQTLEDNHTQPNLLAPVAIKPIKMPNILERFFNKLRPAREDPDTAIEEFLAPPAVHVGVPGRRVSQSSKASRRSCFGRSKSPPRQPVQQLESTAELATTTPKMGKSKYNWPAPVELPACIPMTRYSMPPQRRPLESPDDYFQFRTDQPFVAAAPSQAARPKSFAIDSTFTAFAQAKPQYKAFPGKSPTISPPAHFQPFPGGMLNQKPVPVSRPYIPPLLTPKYANGVPPVLRVAKKLERSQPKPIQAHEKKLSYPLVDIGSELFTNADSKVSSSDYQQPSIPIAPFQGIGFAASINTALYQSYRASNENVFVETAPRVAIMPTVGERVYELDTASPVHSVSITPPNSRADSIYAESPVSPMNEFDHRAARDYHFNRFGVDRDLYEDPARLHQAKSRERLRQNRQSRLAG